MQFGGVFWQTFKGFQASANTLNQLLDKENTSLSEVLDDENVIQEMKSQNQKLIDYLTESKLEEMVDLITVMPDETADHKRGHKHPFIVNEIVSCECWQVLNIFFTSPSLLTRLFKYIESNSRVPILDGYFAKLVTVLVSKNPVNVLGFLQNSNLIEPLIQCLTSKSISDLILRMVLIEQIDLEVRQRVLNALIDVLGSGDQIKVFYASNIFVELVNKSGEPVARGLVLSLASDERLKKIIRVCLDGSDFNVVAGLEVLKALLECPIKEELIRPNKNEDSMTILDEEDSELTKSIIELIPYLVGNLKRDSSFFLGTFQRKVQVLGLDRLKIVDFFYSAVKSELKELLTVMQSHNVFQVLTSLFFTFEQNSILHNTYERFFTFIFDKFASEEEVLINLVRTSKLLESINSAPESSGQSGHIMKLVTTLCRIKGRNSEFSSFLEENNHWQSFFSRVYKKKIEVEKKTLGQPSLKVPEEGSSDDSGHERPAEPKDTLEILLEKSEKSPVKDEEANRPLDMADLEPEPKVKSSGKGKNRYEQTEEVDPAQQLEVNDEEYWRF